MAKHHRLLNNKQKICPVQIGCDGIFIVNPEREMCYRCEKIKMKREKPVRLRGVTRPRSER